MQLQLKREKNSNNNVFRRKQTINKVPHIMFRGFAVRRNVLLIFRRPKDSMKGKCYAVTGYKRRNKVCSVSLDRKVQQDRSG